MDELEEFETGILSLAKYINQEEITRSTDTTYYKDETEIAPDYIKDVFRELEQLRIHIAKMVHQIRNIACPEFMYFVNQFDQEVTDFLELVDAPKNAQTRKSVLPVSQVRNYLCRLQLIYTKIIGIFELYQRDQFPNISYIREYLDRHRHTVLDMISEDIEEHELHPNDYYQELHHFVDEGLALSVGVIHLRIIKILISYWTIYTYSDLPPSIQGFLTGTIARALYRLTTLHEKTESATKTIYMAPVDVLHLFHQLFGELQTFLAFSEEYIVGKATRGLISPSDRHQGVAGDAGSSRGIHAIAELFTSRKCAVCDKLFESALWGFLRQLTRQLGIRIRLIDTYFPQHDALCYGVFGIHQIPSLRYLDRIYYINPAEQAREDPHSTVKRELLDFFGVLGIYDESKGLPRKRPASTDITLRLTDAPEGK